MVVVVPRLLFYREVSPVMRRPTLSLSLALSISPPRTRGGGRGCPSVFRTGGMPGGGGPPLSDASDPGCVHYNEKLEECLPTPRGIAVHPSSEQHLDAADQPNVGGEEWDWQGRSSNHSPPLCSQRDDDTALGCCSLLLL